MIGRQSAALYAAAWVLINISVNAAFIGAKGACRIPQQQSFGQ
jgi:hypothetical protein